MDKMLIEQNFSRGSATYGLASDVQKKCASMLPDLCRRRSAKSILELGCGTGFYTSILLERYSPEEITALDISSDMLERARQNVPDERAVFLRADAEEIGDISRYDILTSNCVFQWFSDLKGYLSEVSGRLKKEAELNFSIYGPETFWELGYVVNHHFGECGYLNARDFLSYQEIRDCVENLFENVETINKNFVMRHDSLMALLRNIKHCGMRGSGMGGRMLYKGDIEHMEHLYRDKFGEITASHQVCFFNCSSPKMESE